MKRWALLIGISQYQPLSFVSAQAAVANVKALDQCLQRAGYTTIVLQDEATITSAYPPSHWPTRSNIEKQLQYLCDKAIVDDDVIVVYFAGHGIWDNDSLLLFAKDADSDRDGLGLDHLLNTLGQRILLQSLFIVEIIRNDSNPPNSNFSVLTYSSVLSLGAKYLPGGWLFNMTDLGDDQQHQASIETANTLFMTSLLEGLLGQADQDRKGRITTKDLGQYVVDTMKSTIYDSDTIKQPPLFECIAQLSTTVLIDFTRFAVRKTPHRAQCFTEPAIQLDLMVIPGGTFLMGSPESELDRDDNESPQHQVTVSTFLMGRYPVTQPQWRSIASRTDLKVNQDLDPDPANFKGDDHPVEQVSWYEAVEFCDRLSRLTGHLYRLPTEAEWEYACRAGTTTPFHFGETITTDLANYRGTDDESRGWSGSYGDGPKGIYREKTTPVNEFPIANAFGLCDMHGNVWEWCADHWHSNYEGAPTDGSAWLSEDENANRVSRGGSWCSFPRFCRSAVRPYYYPGNRYNVVGFRVVCEARSL